MGDSSETIVDIDVSAEEASVCATMIRTWLITEGIIVPEESDCTLGGAGHRPGRNWRKAITPIEDRFDENHFLKLWTNGVAFEIGRNFFHTGQNGIELQCNACKNIFEPNDSYTDLVGEWFGGNDKVSFSCPSCDQQTRISEWRGPRPCALGNLGIAFYNWPPLSEAFIREVSNRLGHRIMRVQAHV